MKKILVAACCALATLPAVSGDWVEGGSVKYYDQLVDYSSIEKTGDIRGAWILAISGRPGEVASYGMMWCEYNCKTKKARDLDYVLYDHSGNVLEQGVFREAWRRVMPGTIDEITFRSICKNPKPKVIFPNTAPRVVADKVRKARTAAGDWK